MRPLRVFGVGLVVLCSVTASAQREPGNYPPYLHPAFDTYTPDIPGVVKAGTRVQVLHDHLNGNEMDPEPNGEGPVAMPDGSLVFTLGSKRQLLRVDKNDQITTFMENISASGIGFDSRGRMISNDGLRGGIFVIHPKGAETTLVDKSTPGYTGAGDLVVDRKGGVYFTQSGSTKNVGYVLPDGKSMKIVVPAGIINRPNGLTLSPDEKILYVNDNRGEHMLAWDVLPDGSLTNQRKFAKYEVTINRSSRGDTGPGREYSVQSCADGLAVDTEGRVYNSGCNGIQVYSPQGRHLGTIPVSRVMQNLAFAGPDKKTLYLVGRNALWKIPMLSQGTARAK